MCEIFNIHYQLALFKSVKDTQNLIDKKIANLSHLLAQPEQEAQHETPN